MSLVDDKEDITEEDAYVKSLRPDQKRMLSATLLFASQQIGRKKMGSYQKTLDALRRDDSFSGSQNNSLFSKIKDQQRPCSSSSESFTPKTLTNLINCLQPAIFTPVFKQVDAPPPVTVSRKSRVLNVLSKGNFSIDRHYIPFKHVNFFPIACTGTHAFGIIKQRVDGTFHPVVMKLENNVLSLPYNAYIANNRFVSPWRQRLEGFDSYLGGCAFGNFMCIVTHESVVVLGADWTLTMLDSSTSFDEVSCCVMNHEFLVIVGMMQQQKRLLIYRWNHSARSIIRKNIKLAILSIKLVVEGDSTLLFTNIHDNNGFVAIYKIKDTQQGDFGSFIVLDEYQSSSASTSSSSQQGDDSSRWSLVTCNNFTLLSNPENVLFSKMVNDGTVVQITKEGITARFLDESISSFSEMEAPPVDVISYTEGIYIVHDEKNALRFYDMFDFEITVAKSEDILAPMLLLKRPIPPVSYYYDSISLCLNNRTIALLLTSGCLCFISPLG